MDFKTHGLQTPNYWSSSRVTERQLHPSVSQGDRKEVFTANPQIQTKEVLNLVKDQVFGREHLLTKFTGQHGELIACNAGNSYILHSPIDPSSPKFLSH